MSTEDPKPNDERADIEHADSERTDIEQPEQELLPPAVSAADINRGNRPRARFDDGLHGIIDETARRRAPNPHSEFRHKVGVAGEIAVSGYFRMPMNRDCYDDYEGDDGWDVPLEIRGQTYRVEVKTVCRGETVLRVDESRARDADFFVLCQTSAPSKFVELVGIASRRRLLQNGRSFPGESTLQLSPSQMHILEPLFITPDRIREAQSIDL